MIDLTKKLLPSAIRVGGRLYPIHTEHYYWINFSIQIESKSKVNPIDFDYLYVDEKPEDRAKGFEQLVAFCFPKSELPRRLDDGPQDRVLDYETDSDLIYSAFLDCYHIDIVDTPLHWHKFRALLEGLHDTKLSEIQGYRLYKDEKSDLKKQYQRLKNAWKLDEKLTQEEQKAIADFDSQLK